MNFGIEIDETLQKDILVLLFVANIKLEGGEIGASSARCILVIYVAKQIICGRRRGQKVVEIVIISTEYKFIKVFHLTYQCNSRSAT